MLFLNFWDNEISFCFVCFLLLGIVIVLDLKGKLMI